MVHFSAILGNSFLSFFSSTYYVLFQSFHSCIGKILGCLFSSFHFDNLSLLEMMLGNYCVIVDY